MEIIESVRKDLGIIEESAPFVNIMYFIDLFIQRDITAFFIEA